MAKSSATGPSTRARTGRIALVSLILVLVSVTVAFAGPLALTPSGSVSQYSWDPSSATWIKSLNKAYWEGETVVMAAEITNQHARTLDLPICLQVTQVPFTGAYAFTNFEPFYTTTRAPNLPPPTLPGGEAITYDAGAPTGDEWALSILPISGYNISIKSVSAMVMGPPNCNANELGLVVTFMPLSERGYILWGGHVAKVGDPIPAGAPEPPGQEDGVVSPGESARFIEDPFEATLKTEGGDKDLPCQIETGPNAVELSSFGASASQALPYGLSLLGLAAAGAAGFAFRRRKQG
jgi:hypothetical protein